MKLKSFLHKTVGLYIIAGLLFVWSVTSVFAQNGGNAGGTTTDAGFGVNPETSNGIKGVGWVGSDQGDSIIDVIKTFINYALGLLALIAFVMLLRWGYKMVVSGGDDKAYQEWLKILKNAAIGIAFIAVSWFLVTFIFYVVNLITN